MGWQDAPIVEDPAASNTPPARGPVSSRTDPGRMVTSAQQAARDAAAIPLLQREASSATDPAALTGIQASLAARAASAGVATPDATATSPAWASAPEVQTPNGPDAIPQDPKMAGRAPAPPTPLQQQVAALKANPPTIADQVVGGIEAGLNVITNIVNAPLGIASGLVRNVAAGAGAAVGAGVTAVRRTTQGVPQTLPGDPSVGDSLTDVLSGPDMQAVTYQPKSLAGQEDVEDVVAPAFNALGPLIGHGHEVTQLHEAAGPAVQAAGDAARAGGATAADVAANAGTAVAKGVAKKIGVDPELAKVAQIASDLPYPIDVRPDQVVQNAKFSKLVGQASSDVPLSNSKTASNQEAFTRNVIDAINPDETAERLTPEVFADAMNRSGQGIGDILAKTPVPLEDFKGLDALREDADKFATDNDKRIVNNYIDELQSKADDNGVVDGTALKELNSEIGLRARSEVGNDLGRRLNDLQGIIQEAADSNITDPADVQALRDYRRQYAYGKIIEPLVAKTIDGNISPSALIGRATATNLGKHLMAMGKAGPLGDLAKVGKLIQEPGSSGTAERNLIYGAATSVAKTAKAAAIYPAAVAYNTLGPKLTRAMVGKRPKAAAPPEPEEFNPTTSPGAGGGGGSAPPAGPGPLGDLTPDWETTPGAGGGRPRGGHEPGLVRPIDEPSPTTGNRKAPLQVPAVPGRPDLPDTLVAGGPAESAATDRANTAMLDPGAIEARRQQGFAPPDDSGEGGGGGGGTPPAGPRPTPPAQGPSIAEAQRLLRDNPDPVVRKVLEDHIEQAKQLQRERAAQEAKDAQAAQLERTARETVDPVLQKRLLDQANKLRGTKPIPVGETREGQPEIKAGAPTRPLPVGKATEKVLTDDDWRQHFGMDADRAQAVAQALKHDPEAVERAAVQHDNQPRAFDRVIADINEKGATRENETQPPASEGQGLHGTEPAQDAGAPVRPGEGPAPVPGESAGAGDAAVPATRAGATGQPEPEPGAAVRGADEHAGADSVPEAGRGSVSAPGGRRQGEGQQEGAGGAGVKGPEQQTEAEFGAPRQAAHIADLEKELDDAKKGKLQTGRFSAYKSKADAVRKITEALDRARSDKPERYASDHLAEINKAIREGKTPSPENIKRYQLEHQFPDRAPVDRRQDTATRKRVADMSPDEMAAALHTDDLTGLRNGRWLRENEDNFSHVVAFDADSLKWVNDNMGHAAGDQLLKAWGEALRQATDNSARAGGDEFFALAHSADEARGITEAVKKTLDNTEITADTPDGQKITIKGVGASFGIGTDRGIADENLNAHKQARQASGARAARGEEPPGTSRTPRGSATGQQDHVDQGQRQNDQVGAARGTDTQPDNQPGGVRGQRPTPAQELGDEAFHVAGGQGEEQAPFYSTLQRGVEALTQKKASPEHWVGILKSIKGVKPEEIEWSGVNDWLKAQQGSVTREALAQYLRDGGVKVQEVTKGERFLSRQHDYEAAQDRMNDLEDQITKEAGVMTGPMWLEARNARPVDGVPQHLLDAYKKAFADYEAAAKERDARTGETRYSQYQLPGGSNYREVLLTLPEPDRLAKAKEAGYTASKASYGGADYWQIKDKDGTGIGTGRGANADEALRSWANVAKNLTGGNTFRSGHWDEPNVLAHVRLNDRTDAAGKKVLFVEELQSDWAQKGKRVGFRDEAAARAGIAKRESMRGEIEASEKALADARSDMATIAGRALKDMGLNSYEDIIRAGDKRAALKAEYDRRIAADPKSAEARDRYIRANAESDRIAQAMNEAERSGDQGAKVPAAPFVGNTSAWTSLAIKRIAKMAADEGYDRVAFINGEQSADRYDLSKQVKSVSVYRDGEGFKVSAVDQHGDTLPAQSIKDAAELENTIGKDLATKAITDLGERRSMVNYSGLDLKVGGEGMKAFYDKIVPNVAKDVVKKLGGDGLTTTELPAPSDRWGAQKRAIEAAGGHGPWEHLTRSERERRIAAEDASQPSSTQTAFDITPKMRETVAGGVPLFKTGDKAAPPVFGTAEKLDAHLRSQLGNKAVDALQAQGLLKYNSSVAEGKAGAGGMMRQPNTPDARPSATLYYDALGPHNAVPVLMHELGEHFGIIRLLGADRYYAMLNDLKGLKDTPEVKAAWDHVEKNYVGPSTMTNYDSMDHPNALREVAARLVEDHPNLPFVRRLINEIRAFFYEHFGTTMGNRVDANLVRGLAAAALRKAERGTLPNMTGPQPRRTNTYQPMVPKMAAATPPPARAPPKPMVAPRVVPRDDGFPPLFAPSSFGVDSRQSPP